MENPSGEPSDGVLRLDFDRRLMFQFRRSVVTSNAGLLAYRELDDARADQGLAADQPEGEVNEDRRKNS
jgi:hypothetical protein